MVFIARHAWQAQRCCSTFIVHPKGRVFHRRFCRRMNSGMASGVFRPAQQLKKARLHQCPLRLSVWSAKFLNVRLSKPMFLPEYA